MEEQVRLALRRRERQLASHAFANKAARSRAVNKAALEVALNYGGTVEENRAWFDRPMGAL